MWSCVALLREVSKLMQPPQRRARNYSLLCSTLSGRLRSCSITVTSLLIPCRFLKLPHKA